MEIVEVIKKVLFVLLLIYMPIQAINDVQYLLRYLDELYEPADWQKAFDQTNSLYDSVLYETLDRRFSLQFLPTYTFGSSAFNECGESVPLGQALFCGCTFLEDIYLPAFLSKDGLLLPDNTNQSPCEQFLTQLADVRLNFCAQEKTFVFNVAGFYRFCINECIDGYVGLNIPVVYQENDLELILTGGTLLEEGESSVTVLCQFFSQYSGTQEFVIEMLQDCKDIFFDPEQSKTGIGDIQAVIFAEFGDYFKQDVRLAAGLNVSFASSPNPTGQILWETQLGSGGVTVINPFIDTQYFCNWYWNPRIFASGFFYPNYDTVRRVPRLVENLETQLVQDTILCVPDDFDDFIVEPFEGVDSSCPLLADTAPCVCVDQGPGILVHIANEFQDIFSTDLKFNIGYVFIHQDGSTIEVQDAPEESTTYLPDQAVGIEESTSHIVEWNIGYNPKDYFSLVFGSAHIVAGRNSFKDNRIFAQFIAYF